MENGIQAVISPRFGDIFRNNATKTGLVPVQVDEETQAELFAAPGAEVVIDFAAGMLVVGERRAAFPIEPFARYCVLNGRTSCRSCCRARPRSRAFEAAAGPVPWRTS